MASFDIPVAMQGGFQSLAAAKAHRGLIGKLTENVSQAESVAADWRSEDRADVGNTPSDLYKDLAPGKGHVIILTQPEGAPLMGAELRYNPEDGSTRSLVVDRDQSKLTQQGSTFKLEENGVTTYFRRDDKRGVFTVFDADSEVPRIFGDADPKSLIGSTLQIPQNFLIF